MRILVVDDDEGTRALLADDLQDEGHEVVQAADGAGALARLRDWRPDLILLDLLMPGIDGWAFAAAYEAYPPPRAPLVLLTAANITAEARVARRPFPAAAAILPKPFELADLLRVVREQAPRP